MFDQTTKTFILNLIQRIENKKQNISIDEILNELKEIKEIINNDEKTSIHIPKSKPKPIIIQPNSNYNSENIYLVGKKQTESLDEFLEKKQFKHAELEEKHEKNLVELLKYQEQNVNLFPDDKIDDLELNPIWASAPIDIPISTPIDIPISTPIDIPILEPIPVAESMQIKK